MQNFENHTRYYSFHHFVLTPLTIIFLVWSLADPGSRLNEGSPIQPALYMLVLAIILVLLPIVMRIYALKNQNRIIRLEMRQRYFELTGGSFHDLERKLRFSQIIALRFAGDEEMIPLINKTIKENLKSTYIKKNIKNWQEDRHRV